MKHLGSSTPKPSGILRSSALVAVGTGLSRLTGLARTMAMAYALGGELMAGTYNLANTTPNVIYDLILGGVLTATLVPIIVDRLDRRDQRAIDALATVITAILVVLTVVAMLAAPFIIDLYTAFTDDPAEAERQASLAVPLLVMFMPQVLFYGLTALWTAVLNARRSFAVPAFAPILNNLVVILLLLGLRQAVGSDLGDLDSVVEDPTLLLLLGLGTTAGIVAMTLVLWPAMRHAGVRLRFNPDWRNPAIRTVARLSAWTLGYVAANQVVFVVVLSLLNGLPGTREVAAYTYAWQFFQLPVGLFVASIMTTFTPELATHAVRRNMAAFKRRFVQGLRLGLLVVLPAAALLAVMARPLVVVLLQQGDFGPEDSEATASALSWLALGLPGFAGFLFTMRGFYAFRDTRTPFFLNLVENGLQIALTFVLVGPFGMQGVLAAFGIAYTVAAVASAALLARRTGGFGGLGLGPGLIRQLIAAAVTSAALLGLRLVLDVQGRAGSLALLLAGAVVACVVYAAALLAMRSTDLALVRELRSVRPTPSGETVP